MSIGAGLATDVTERTDTRVREGVRDGGLDRTPDDGDVRCSAEPLFATDKYRHAVAPFAPTDLRD